MIISMMDALPGYRVTEVLGAVIGVTVCGRRAGTQIGAELKSMFGVELDGVTQILHESRIEARRRISENAAALGADAVLAFRFDANDLGELGQERCAYGTAVRVQKATRT
jgi:uncharacterized protein YbjQ (UPF0145 family)